MYDYANILFTGKRCNLDCYECIGNHPSLISLPVNTDVFPINNIDKLIDKVNQEDIKDLAFTGTNVDPQLYKHEIELIKYIREKLTTKTNLSLHTNGLLALKKIEVFNAYDKASISLPSFNISTYAQITKSKNMPNLKEILKQTRIPIKLSMLITPFNINETTEYIEKSSELGIKRIVIRKLKDHDKEYPIENLTPFKDLTPVKEVFGWPVYDLRGTEVTICSFDKSTARGLFLFSDGKLEDKLI